MRAVEMGVDDRDVARRRLGLGELGEAPGRLSAVPSTWALLRRCRDHGPDERFGLKREFGSIPRGRPSGPRHQGFELVFDRERSLAPTPFVGEQFIDR